MARSVHQIPLENFVKGYLKKISATSNKSGEIKFLEKAISLIQQELGFPCCVPNSAVYTNITPHDNQLTIMVKAAITNNDIIRRPFLMSLKRILNLLNFYLYGCCDTSVTVTFDVSIAPSAARLRLVDLVTNTIIFTTALSGTPQTFLVPAKYLGPNATVQVQLLTVTNPAGHTNEVLHGVTVLASGTVIGTATGITQPVVTTYTIKQI